MLAASLCNQAWAETRVIHQHGAPTDLQGADAAWRLGFLVARPLAADCAVQAPGDGSPREGGSGLPSVARPCETSAKDTEVHLYYALAGRTYLCVVTAPSGQRQRFVVTAYFTKNIKHGMELWKK
jgi:hypothetical protein